MGSAFTRMKLTKASILKTISVVAAELKHHHRKRGIDSSLRTKASSRNDRRRTRLSDAHPNRALNLDMVWTSSASSAIAQTACTRSFSVIARAVRKQCAYSNKARGRNYAAKTITKA